MSLHQGPKHSEELTVESCLETLSKLLLRCQEEGADHQEKIDHFFSQQTLIEPGSGDKIKLADIRHLPDRYPENLIVTHLAQKAHLYILTVRGNLTILKEGCKLLRAAVIKESETLNNLNFKILDLSVLHFLAKTKLKLEHKLEKFSNKHPKISKGSAEELLKSTIEEPLTKLTERIAKLAPCERYAIEYFGTILDSQRTFKLLIQYQSLLVELTKVLATLTPIVPKSVANEDWDNVFPMEDFPLDLSVRLQKLQVSDGKPNSSDDDDERWAEVNAFEPSSLTFSSYLETSLSSSRPATSEPILTQYLQSTPVLTVDLEEPAQPITVIAEEEKKISTPEFSGL
ncbi:MAG TPA: hypothetical protein PLD88_06140 [Candidatus Berkiella sp.]|nr:hypothetical protein [Candidatus Berkiella sp.]